jgi:hypothetical protein
MGGLVARPGERGKTARAEMLAYGSDAGLATPHRQSAVLAGRGGKFESPHVVSYNRGEIIVRKVRLIPPGGIRIAEICDLMAGV